MGINFLDKYSARPYNFLENETRTC